MTIIKILFEIIFQRKQTIVRPCKRRSSFSNICVFRHGRDLL